MGNVIFDLGPIQTNFVWKGRKLTTKPQYIASHAYDSKVNTGKAVNNSRTMRYRQDP